MSMFFTSVTNSADRVACTCLVKDERSHSFPLRTGDSTGGDWGYGSGA